MVRSASRILARSPGEVFRPPEEAYRGPIGGRARMGFAKGALRMTLRTGRGSSPGQLGIAAALALCASAVNAQAPAQPADLIVTHARVITLGPAHAPAAAGAGR